MQARPISIRYESIDSSVALVEIRLEKMPADGIAMADTLSAAGPLLSGAPRKTQYARRILR